MTPVGWGEDDLELRPLDTPPLEFDCGRPEQDEYLLEYAVDDQNAGVSRTYLAFIKGIVAGYVTVSADSLRLYSRERPSDVRFPSVPALKIGQLGVAERWQGCGLGKRLIHACIILAQDLSEHVGLRYVTVDAKTDVVDLYLHLGFKRNKLEASDRRERDEARGLDPEESPVSLRFDIRDPEGQFTMPLPPFSDL